MSSANVKTAAFYTNRYKNPVALFWLASHYTHPHYNFVPVELSERLPVLSGLLRDQVHRLRLRECRRIGGANCALARRLDRHDEHAVRLREEACRIVRAQAIPHHKPDSGDISGMF